LCHKDEIAVVAKAGVRNSMPGSKNTPTLAFSLPVFMLKQAEMVRLNYD